MSAARASSMAVPITSRDPVAVGEDESDDQAEGKRNRRRRDDLPTDSGEDHAARSVVSTARSARRTHSGGSGNQSGALPFQASARPASSALIQPIASTY